MRKKCVINNITETGWVESEMGVRHGCFLSPTLFSLLISKFGEKFVTQEWVLKFWI